MLPSSNPFNAATSHNSRSSNNSMKISPLFWPDSWFIITPHVFLPFASRAKGSLLLLLSRLDCAISGGMGWVEAPRELLLLIPNIWGSSIPRKSIGCWWCFPLDGTILRFPQSCVGARFCLHLFQPRNRVIRTHGGWAGSGSRTQRRQEGCRETPLWAFVSEREDYDHLLPV